MFREGIHSLWDAIWRSLAFGLAHMLVGVPLAAALAIACVGVVLAAAYAIGGIPLSFAVHFHYDVAIFGVIAIGVCGKFARKLWNMRHH